MEMYHAETHRENLREYTALGTAKLRAWPCESSLSFSGETPNGS